MKRRNFLKKLAQVTAATSFVAADAKAFGLFTTSFWKKRPAAAAWLTQANTIDYFGGGGLADSPIGIGARVCRMGNGTVGMFAGLSGNSSQVNAYVTGAANGPFTINGSYTPAATYADSVGDQLEVECVKSTVTNQYYTIWSTGNSTYGLHAAKVASNAAGTAVASAFAIGGQGAGAYPSSGPVVGIVNSSDQLLIGYFYPSALTWSLLNSSLGVTTSKVTNGSVPICYPFAGFSVGTDFYLACGRAAADELVIVKINSSGAYVSHSVFTLTNALAPHTGNNNRGEAMVISSTSVALVWRSKTGKAIFANFNPTASTFTTSAMDLGFPVSSMTAVVATKNASNQIIVNCGQYFIMVDSVGATVKSLLQVASVRGGSGGIAFRQDETRLILVETINVSPEKSGLYAREFIIT